MNTPVTAPAITTLQNISHNISRLLLIPAGMALISLIVSAVARDSSTALPFVLTSISALALSGLLHVLGKPAKTSSQRQILLSVGLGWGVISLIGALPLWLTALLAGSQANPTVANFTDFLTALFEGFSGFTSAGLTMVIRESELPLGLQWWRSFMQWVGGVGVIVLAIALLKPEMDQYVLYKAEGRQSRIRLTLTGTVRRIWAIYTGYTVFGLFLLRATGMTWWAALNHSMSAISTGGFSITDGSMAPYSSAVKLAVMLLMILGAVSFSVHDKLISQRRISALWQNRQHVFLFGLLAIGSLVVGLEHHRFIGRFAWVDSAFQWVSALTTCGFASDSIQVWSDRNKLLLSLAMVFGGAAGSTAGGLKLNRVLALIEAVAWRYRRTSMSSRQIVMREIDGQQFTPEQASRKVEDATALLLMWIMGIGTSVILLIPLVSSEYTLSDIVFESAAALGSAGLSVGITSPYMAASAKALLMVLMWMGRLEIIPVVMLIYAPWRYLLRRGS